MRKINLCKQRSRIFKVRGRWFVVWHQIGGTTTNYCLGTSFVGTRVWCWRNFPCDLGRRVEQTPTATVTELILQDIQQIFLRPKSLLPQETMIMQIVLQAGETSVNVRPYQYPLTAKMREKSVRDLLNTTFVHLEKVLIPIPSFLHWGQGSSSEGWYW